VPDIRQRPDLLEMAVGISENLLTPIGKPLAEGKDYARSKWLGAISLFGEVDKSGSAYGGRKAYKERKSPTGTLRRRASLWDMILPLLKPPLVLEFSTQIDLPSSLRPYQVPGVKALFENSSFLLADQMGTGKTVMACVAIRMLFHKGLIRRALVVCPAGVIPVWDKHLEEWGGPAITCTVVRGNRVERERDWRYPAHVYLTSYETLRNDVSDGPLSKDSPQKQFDLVIADEAHKIKNPGAGISRAVTSLKPQYRWAMTGTPLLNHLDDLAGIFRFVKPGHFPRETPTPEQASQLIAPYFLRRKKADVLPDLPPKTPDNDWLEMDAEQKAAHDRLLGQEQEEIRAGRVRVTHMHIFNIIRKLRWICNFAPGQCKSPKTERLMEQLEEILEESKACVFSHCLGEGLDKIRPHLEPYGVVEIRGETSDRNRARAIHDFQNNPDVRVFLGSTKAAGEGITLTAANYVFHFDQWWHPHSAFQAEDRTHRIGQVNPVSVYSYWMLDSYEVRLYDILQRKGLLFQEVIESMSEQDINNSITVEEWCDVLGLKVPQPQIAEDLPGAPKSDRNLGEVYHMLSSISPSAFEEVVAEAFRAMGYPKVRVTGQSHDGGIDVRAERAALGSTERIVIQCKRKNQVGVEAARDLLGVVSADPRISKGYLVCSGTLSQACKDFVTEHGRLAFLDGLELAKRIIELKIPLTDS